MIQIMNEAIIKEFRENGGKVGGHFVNTPLLLLHTVGAKSGEARLNPAAYFTENDRYIIIASKGGAPNHPDWYHNIVANPEVSVEVGTEKFQALATEAEEPQRTQLYEKMVALNPGFAEYLKKTTRTIPVIIVTRTP